MNATLNPYNVTPYRLVVCARGVLLPALRRRSRKTQTPKTSEYAYMGWTPIQFFDAGARLPGAGSFLYAGALRAMEAAREYLRLPDVHQVQIRTDQDRTVLVYNKNRDGKITFYNAEEN